MFTVLPLFFFFEDPEGFAGEIRDVAIFGIENITKFITDNTIILIYLSLNPYPPHSIFDNNLIIW
jgi:hypothetical protein